MSITLREKVLTFLTVNADESYTNAEIAARIGHPVPSVRRETRLLVSEAAILAILDKGVDMSSRFLPVRYAGIPTPPPSSL